MFVFEKLESPATSDRNGRKTLGFSEEVGEFTDPSCFLPDRTLPLGGRLLTVETLVPPEGVRGLNSPPVASEPYGAFQEAVKRMESGLDRATGVMCRYAIIATLFDKGVLEMDSMNMRCRRWSQGTFAATIPEICVDRQAVRRYAESTGTELLN